MMIKIVKWKRAVKISIFINVLLMTQYHSYSVWSSEWSEYIYSTTISERRGGKRRIYVNESNRISRKTAIKETAVLIVALECTE
jgi:hypothetical protein